MFSSYLQSPEFNRTARNATDSGLKLFFKGISIAVVGLAKFLKHMLMTIVGK